MLFKGFSSISSCFWVPRFPQKIANLLLTYFILLMPIPLIFPRLCHIFWLICKIFKGFSSIFVGMPLALSRFLQT